MLLTAAATALTAMVALATPSGTSRPTVYISSDSTVMTYPSSYAPQMGWGQKIADNFTQDVRFVNRAIGGRSSRSFVVEGRLDAILSEIQPDDYLFIQFGHNDASSDPNRHTDPYTTFKKYLRLYIRGAREHGAIPVLITPVARRHPTADGRFINDFPHYCNAIKQLAEEENAAVIDLNSDSIDYYTSIGVEATMDVFLFVPPGVYPHWPDGAMDNTHFQEYGASQIAYLVAQAVLALDLPISAYVQ
jgi:lysophospholipase L1-like esterase